MRGARGVSNFQCANYALIVNCVRVVDTWISCSVPWDCNDHAMFRLLPEKGDLLVLLHGFEAK